MSTASIVVHGTVTPDGGLSVDQKVPLPPGPVQITIQPEPKAVNAQKDWWQRLQEGRAILESRGSGFRSQAEIEAEREAFRAEDESTS